MASTIDIFITGLIALMSNESTEPTLTTAYVVKDAQHVAMIRFVGDLTVMTEPGAPPCSSYQLDGKDVVRCDLGDTDITFNPQVRKGLLFADKPSKKMPALGEENRVDWALRMNNIESGVGKIKKTGIDPWISAKLIFSWTSAETCELDGSERGWPALIGFKKEGTISLHQQAVAECLRFRLNATLSSQGKFFSVILKDEPSGKITTVHVKCSDGSCLTMELSNRPTQKYSCKDEIDEGGHFHEYYNLVERPGLRMSPYSVGEKCKEKKFGDPFDAGLFEYGLQVMTPLDPEFVEAIREEVRQGRVGTWREVKELIEGQSRDKSLRRESSVEFKKILAAVLEVQDRIICPPVVIDNK